MTVKTYTWRKKYGGMNVADAQRLKQLEDENRKLKQMLADALLDNKVGPGCFRLIDFLRVCAPSSRGEYIVIGGEYRVLVVPCTV